jgi:hypothetical protein
MSKQYGVSEDLFPSEKPRLNFSFREMATCAVPRRVIDIPDACWRDIRVSSKEIPRIIFVFDASQSRNVHSVNCNNVFARQNDQVPTFTEVVLDIYPLRI